MTDAPYPHCSTTTIHAPGECHYCDQHPALQEARRVSGEPFSPGAANGWSGNVAVKAGEVHSHLGGPYVVGGEREPQPCKINMKRGWRCTRGQHADGPCALVPDLMTRLADSLRRALRR